MWVLNATPWPLTPEKKSGTHCIGFDLGQVWTAAENLVQDGIQSPAVQLVVSHYTNHAIPTHTFHGMPGNELHVLK